MIVVGIGNRSRAGKTTVAKMLNQICRLSGRFKSVNTVPFARKIKQVACDVFGIYGLKNEEFYEQNEHLKNVPLVIGKTPVELWVKVGDTMKEFGFSAVWRDHALVQKYDLLIVPDLRYVEEWNDICNMSGIKVRVDRASSESRGSDHHLSAEMPWDFVIDNNGTREQLFAQVEALYKNLIEPRI